MEVSELFPPNVFDIRFAVWGERMEPSSITATFKLAASRSFQKGDSRVSPSGNVFVPKTSVWELDISNGSKNYDVEECIQMLVEKLRHIKGGILSIDGVEGAHISCAISGDLDKRSREFNFSSDLMGHLSRLQVNLKIVVV